MTKFTLGLAAALSLLAGAAVAEGLPERALPPAPVACCEAPQSWTGFYVGAGLGAGAVVHNVSGFFDGIGGEGGFGTAIVGYDRQFGRIVAGVFLDYDFSSISTNTPFGSLDQKHAWSVGARVGLLASPSTLWYAAAGYTETKFAFNGASLPDFKGYFVGGGVEAQLADGFSLRAEYRFSQFDQETVFDLEPSMHTARIALTYKFGRREEVAPLK